jgi:23S rRNA pseudouridine1911/1915/1917 synthase
LIEGINRDNEIITSGQDDIGKRIDSWLAEELEDMSRTYLQKLIAGGMVLVNGKPVKANYRIRHGDIVKLAIPEPQPLETGPENIHLNILYEDEHIIVIDKPQGMVVHPAAGNRSGTLVNALIHHYGDNLSDINGVLRPGIVHRLDKDTSGVLLVAKTNTAHRKLTDMFKGHEIKKIYFAIVEGKVATDKGKIDAPVGRHPVDRKKMAVNPGRGRNAVTHFQVIERFKNCTMLKIRLETGRTHQIRVHMAFIGHPVLGDNTYGKKHVNRSMGIDKQMLHAGLIGFRHPVTGEYMEFESKLPGHFNSVLDMLRNENFCI